MPKLHIEGRYLKDSEGNIVNLHGFAQTYSPYFNESMWSNYDVDACLRYNQGLIRRMLAAGWEMDFIRLHMDPYWSNTPGCQATGENDIHCFEEARFKKYLDQVLFRWQNMLFKRYVCSHASSWSMSGRNCCG